MATSGSTDQVAGTTALPPRADLRASTSAFRPVTSASPPGADVPGGAAVRLLLTHSSDSGRPAFRKTEAHSGMMTRLPPTRSDDGAGASGTPPEQGHWTVALSIGDQSDGTTPRLAAKSPATRASGEFAISFTPIGGLHIGNPGQEHCQLRPCVAPLHGELEGAPSRRSARQPVKAGWNPSLPAESPTKRALAGVSGR